MALNGAVVLRRWVPEWFQTLKRNLIKGCETQTLCDIYYLIVLVCSTNLIPHCCKTIDEIRKDLIFLCIFRKIVFFVVRWKTCYTFVSIETFVNIFRECFLFRRRFFSVICVKYIIFFENISHSIYHSCTLYVDEFRQYFLKVLYTFSSGNNNERCTFYIRRVIKAPLKGERDCISTLPEYDRL